MRIPRDVDAVSLVANMERHGYEVVRQRGSHIRLTKLTASGRHDITVSNHSPIKIGTLSSIVKDICKHNGISESEFYHSL